MRKAALFVILLLSTLFVILVGCYDTLSPASFEYWLTISNVDGSNVQYIKYSDGTPYFIPAPEGVEQNILRVKKTGFEIIDQRGHHITDLYPETERYDLNRNFSLSSDGSMFVYSDRSSATNTATDIFLGYMDGSGIFNLTNSVSQSEYNPVFTSALDGVVYVTYNKDESFSQLIYHNIYDHTTITIAESDSLYGYFHPVIISGDMIVVSVMTSTYGVGYILKTSIDHSIQEIIATFVPNHCRISVSTDGSTGITAEGPGIYEIDFNSNSVTSLFSPDKYIQYLKCSKDMHYLAHGYTDKTVVDLKTGDILLYAENSSFLEFSNENKVIYNTIRKFVNGVPVE